MHPSNITHLGAEYSLTHLRQHFGSFNWRGEDKLAMKFSVRVRYSTHCYSIKKEGAFLKGECVVWDGVGKRLFCPTRHIYSLSLPVMMGALFEKPVTTIGPTEKKSWSIYRMQMEPPLATGEKYYVFFRIKPPSEPARGTDSYQLDLHVESAYPRMSIIARSQIPFGKVAEQIAKGRR